MKRYKRRGFANALAARISYALRHSSTVIASRPSMIAISLLWVSRANEYIPYRRQILPSGTCAYNVVEIVTRKVIDQRIWPEDGGIWGRHVSQLHSWARAWLERMNAVISDWLTCLLDVRDLLHYSLEHQKS